MSERPAWNHKTEYDLACWLYDNTITKVTHHWEMTGPETSEDWTELHSDKGESRRYKWGSIHYLSEVFFSPDHRSLIRMSDALIKDVAAIRKWQKQNAADIAELARLKRKLGVC